MNRSLAPLALAGGLVLALAGCSAATSATSVPVAAVTLAPQPLPPPAPARLAEPVAAGTVVHGPGPFDDRFALRGTRLSRGTVDASLLVTSDVSEVIVLEAVADFYDADGALLGTTRQTHAPEHEAGAAGTPDEHVALELRAAPAYRSRVASAVLSVPVLVNE